MWISRAVIVLKLQPALDGAFNDSPLGVSGSLIAFWAKNPHVLLFPQAHASGWSTSSNSRVGDGSAGSGLQFVGIGLIQRGGRKRELEEVSVSKVALLDLGAAWLWEISARLFWQCSLISSSVLKLFLRPREEELCLVFPGDRLLSCSQGKPSMIPATYLTELLEPKHTQGFGRALSPCAHQKFGTH